jgi:hypothetical protein
VGHAAHMAEGKCLHDFRWEDQGKDRITLRWTLGREGSMRRTGFGWLWIEASGEVL